MFLTFVSIRAAIALVAIVLVYRFSREGPDPQPSRGSWSEFALLNLGLISMVIYFGIALHPRPWVNVHYYDIFHYYLGAKYSPEVGYQDLYYCAAVADAEVPGGYGTPALIRKMDDYSWVSGQSVIERGDEYRALFTEDRWEEFRADVVSFRPGLREREFWDRIFRDNGYNATPVWNMTARVITGVIPVQWPPGMVLLVALDAALLVLMFAAIWRTFGSRSSLLAMIFLGSMFLMADGTIRGAFLRLDWLTFLVMATCALKRERYKTAGALVAYAGMARIFPFVFAFGLGAKLVWGLLANRRVDRRHLEFFVVLTLVVAVLLSLSLVTGAGLDGWKAFGSKIQFHDTTMSGLRLGFKTLLLAGVAPLMEDWPRAPKARAARFDEVKLLWWAVLALVFGACFVAVRRLEDYETLPFCYILAFFLFCPTYYYQVSLLLLTLLYLPKLHERPRAHAMAMLFGSSIVGYSLWFAQNLQTGVGALRWKRIDYRITLSMASMLLVIGLYTLGFVLLTGRRAARD